MSPRAVHRRVSQTIAVLLAAAAAVFAIQTSAGATARGHKCKVAVTEGSRQMVQCLDFNVFWNSEGDLAVQTLGASICQPPGGDPVPCAGIRQLVTLYATNTVPSNPDDDSTTRTQVCGWRGGNGCPRGRFFGYSSGGYCHRTLTYVARIRTTVDMPGTGSPFTRVFENRISGTDICYTP
ncbi:hypothetical protein GCM10023107_83480 [Actinoplanes octamycinicus]|nr:hypothetical protein Aoc01nite_67650 [Actinoplanes octamycinicus]